MRTLWGQADANTFTSKNDLGESVDPKHSIFPILKRHKSGEFIFLGTGFFVATTGIFVSASHVFSDVIRDPEVDAFFILQFQESNVYCPRPITSCVQHDIVDIAVGFCAPMTHNETGDPYFNPVLRLSRRRARIGEPLFTYAYPATELRGTMPTQVKVSPTYFDGVVTEYHETKRDNFLMPYPCYRTNIAIHGGASGGPVFGFNGRVIGINSTSIQDHEDISYVCRIEDIMNLGMDNVVFNGDGKPQRATVADLVSKGIVIVE